MKERLKVNELKNKVCRSGELTALEKRFLLEQMERRASLPIELFTVPELIDELKTRIRKYGIKVAGDFPEWLLIQRKRKIPEK